MTLANKLVKVTPRGFYKFIIKINNIINLKINDYHFTL